MKALAVFCGVFAILSGLCGMWGSMACLSYGACQAWSWNSDDDETEE